MIAMATSLDNAVVYNEEHPFIKSKSYMILQKRDLVKSRDIKFLISPVALDQQPPNMSKW